MASQQRIALVIGNGEYRGSRPLPNPVNDAALITSHLKALGYEILGGATSKRHDTGLKAGMDLDSVSMTALIGQFMTQVQPGATALIYYAGHGLQVGGKNYLVPVDDTLDRSLPNLGLIELKPKLETLASRVGSDGTIVAFLDACRDDPMSNEQRKLLLDLLDPPDRQVEHGQAASSTPTRGGLSTVKLSRDPDGGRTFIGFATAPGDYAYDGKKGSTNSPFARALATHLPVRGLEIEELYNRVARDTLDIVALEVGRVQDPWSETNLNRSLYIYPRTPVPVLALGGLGLLVGLLVCSLIFQGGNIARPPATWMWGLGALFGLIGAWGTMQWGSKKPAHAAFAFLGPVCGFAVALAVLMMIPPYPARIDLTANASAERELASYVFGFVTVAGMAVYFIGIVMVRMEKNEPWPRSPLGWLNRIMIWVLPVLVAATLLCIDYLLAYANPHVTATTLCALLAGILYATSAELGCRPQLGLFRGFGAFTGAVSVGLMMAVLFAAFAWIHLSWFDRKLSSEALQWLMVGFGAFWHGLLGAQLGYCFAYYVTDHRRITA